MPEAQDEGGSALGADSIDLIDPENWVGVWSIERRFEFETPGAPSRFRGQATVRRVRPGIYLYSEEGVLEGLGSRSIHATQRYWILPGAGETTGSGRTIELRFAPDPARPDEAPPFTMLEPDTHGALAGRHVCGPDTYAGRYQSSGPHSIEIEWRVDGPRKSGRIVSVLTRASDEMGFA